MLYYAANHLLLIKSTYVVLKYLSLYLICIKIPKPLSNYAANHLLLFNHTHVVLKYLSLYLLVFFNL